VSAPISNVALTPPGVIDPAQLAVPAGTAGAQSAAGPSFDRLLSQRLAGVEPGRPGLQFSRHALERLQQRGIELNAPTVGRLSEGVARAAGKGSRASVVFVDGTAFVVSVTNNTVITAVGAEHMQQHVFTNIDSAVIA
jgi:flagellar operon protein